MKNRLSIMISSLLCILVLVLSLVNIGKGKSVSYDVVFFGDSIVAGEHNDSWTVPVMLGEQMGISVFNAAIGGSTLCDVSNTKMVGDVSSLYSMVSLAKSICQNDFSLQTVGSQNNNIYVDEWRGKVSEELSKVAWDDVRFVLIEQGANDYLTGVPVDDQENIYNNRTFGGALRTTIEVFLERVDREDIVLITPIYMFPEGYDKDCYEMDFGGGTLDKYVEKEIEIASEYGVALIDNFHELSIDRDNYQDYIPGGLHGNYEGNKLIADNITKHLKELDERY